MERKIQQQKKKKWREKVKKKIENGAKKNSVKIRHGTKKMSKNR